MKTTGKCLTNIVLMLSVAFTPDLFAQKNTSLVKEIATIKSLIERETKAFFELDQETWKDSWAHVPYAFWSFADTTDVNSFSGWDAIESGFYEYFNTAKPSKAKIERNWHEIRVFGNGAYARFTQLVSDDEISRGEQAEVRVLEKHNGQWKVVHVGVIASKQPQQIVSN